ncbi:hypothetical protein QO200_18710 [Flavobacterium sp. Arc3]|uniref:hypothetical protein n=1 Tax=Flavobacterium sp. Arc3 TaxID=3046686 RepID=UPI00352F28B8
MKNLLYVFTALLIFSCSSSDDSSGTSSSDINPPTWIQGTWKQEGALQGQGLGFKFSSNDFCTLILNGDLCTQGQIDSFRKAGEKVTVEETISSTSYSAKINYPMGQSVTYSFSKISNTEIKWESSAGVVFIKQ